MKQAWDHQPPAIEYLNTHKGVLLQAIMGAGKSFITVQHCLAQFCERNSKILILCPAAVLGVWRREFHKHAPDTFDVLVLDGGQSSAKKAELVEESFLRQRARQRPVVVVVNYESFWRDKLFKVINEAKFHKVICDESHRIKSNSSACSKKAWEITKLGIPSRLCLTGTPMANGPQDIFGQYRFLNDSVFGRYWTYFKRNYAVENPNIPGMIVKWINQEDFREKVASMRYFIGPEVLNLPERHSQIVYVKLDSAGRKAYDQMRKDSYAEIKALAETSIATAQNGAVQFMRLLQLAQGYVKDTDGNEQTTDTTKRKALLEILEDLDEPVVVYGWFKHDIECVKRCCEILGKRYGEISGARRDLTPDATMPDDVDIIAVQCKSGGTGIDLTRSSIGIIMNSGSLSPGDFDQMLARQHRPGQTRNVRFLFLVTENTVETKLIDSRGKKRDLIEAMLMDVEKAADEGDEVF